MAAPYKANIVLAYTNNWLLQGGVSNDMLIVTTNSNQNILLGSSNTSNIFLKISSNGFIGNATLNPAFPLDITGDVNFTGILRQNGMPYSGSQWSNNTSNLFIFASNVGINVSNVSEGFELQKLHAKFGCNVYVMSNVGIGTSNPSFSLDVTGMSRVGTTTYLDSGNNTGCMRLSVGANATYIESGLTNVTNSAAPLLFRNINGGTEYMRITSAGYLGIGTTSPAYPLDVIGTSKLGNTTIVDSGNNTGCMRLSVGTNATYIESGLTNVTNSAAPIVFRNIQGSTEYMRITTNGCVGIGNASPIVPLDVTGSARMSSLNVGTLVRMPPIFLPYSSTNTYTFNGQSYGNGVYTTLASSEVNSGQNASGVWAVTANWAGASQPTPLVGNVLFPITTVDNRTVSGEWVQINMPIAISLVSYTFTGCAAPYTAPSTFYLLGSTNGIAWNLIDTRAGITNWVLSTPQTFNVQASSAQYTFFKLQIYKTYSLGVLGNNYITINNFYVSGYVSGGLSAGFPTVLPFPPISMPATATTTLTGQSYGNGLYSISASSAYGGSESAYNGWAYSSSPMAAGSGYNWTTANIYNAISGAYTGGISTMVSGVATSGEYLTISLPQPIACTGYTIYGTTKYLAGPVSFVIAGSTDGITWQLIDSKTGINTWSASMSNYVGTLASFTTPYSYFRIICRTNGGDTFVCIGFRINGSVSLPAYPLDIIGNSQTVGSTLIGGLPDSISVFPALPYPPIRLPAEYTTVLSGQPYGNGVYSIAASSAYYEAYYGWAYGPATLSLNYWSTPSGYALSTGLYTGSVSTIVSNVSVLGEWLQLTLPQLISCTGYTIYVSTDLPTSGPCNFTIVGSVDGITWNTVDTQTGINNWSASITSRTFTLLQGAIPYTSFRIIITRTVGASNSSVCCRFQLIGPPVSTTITSQGAVGVGTTNPQYPLDVTGNANFSGNIAAGNIGMFRNRMINGDMRIAQRGTTGNITNGNGGNVFVAVDRFGIESSMTGTLTQTQQTLLSTDTPMTRGFLYATRVTALNAVTANYIGPKQVIEIINVSDLMWGSSNGVSATISCWIKTNAAAGSVVTVTLRCGNSSGTLAMYAVNVPITTSATYQYMSQTISAPPNTFTTMAVLECFIGCYVSGSPYANINAWTTTGTGQYGTTATTNIFATAGNYIEFTGVQLEKSSIVTPFEFRPYAIELQLCQRYFERYSGSLFGIAWDPTSIMAIFNPSIRKRTNVSIANLSVSGPIAFTIPGASTIFTQSSAIISIWNGNTLGNDGTNMGLQFNNFSGLTVGQMYMKLILDLNSSAININTEF